MASTTNQVIYLGRFADADTNEASTQIEDNSIYQQTFGSSGSPLKNQITTAQFTDGNGSSPAIETDNTGLPGDFVTHDVGTGSQTYELDSLAVVTMDVTYNDGSTVSFSQVVMFQTTQGDLFLGNSDFRGTDIALPMRGGIQSIDVTSVENSSYTGLMNENLQDFVCFAAGTHIMAKHGEVAVEELAVGDLIRTLDHGFQPLRWVGTHTFQIRDDAGPIQIGAGALSPNVPHSDLIVSPQHRILVSSLIAERMFGMPQVLVPSKALLPLEGVHSSAAKGQSITYFHLLFDRHEIVFAEGALTESFFIGDQSLKLLSPRQVWQVLAARGSAGSQRFARMQPARQFVVGRKRGSLIARHIKNQTDVFVPYVRSREAPQGEHAVRA
jgi:hypothetical protein